METFCTTGGIQRNMKIDFFNPRIPHQMNFGAMNCRPIGSGINFRWNVFQSKFRYINLIDSAYGFHECIRIQNQTIYAKKIEAICY